MAAFFQRFDEMKRKRFEKELEEKETEKHLKRWPYDNHGSEVGVKDSIQIKYHL